MPTVSISDAKNRLSALLDQVKAGETVVISDRGVPVARLEPVTARSDDPEGRLSRLERAGLLARPRQPFPRALLDRRPTALSRGASVVTLLIEERRTGR
jgi:prevent-host-death family protein